MNIIKTLIILNMLLISTFQLATIHANDGKKTQPAPRSPSPKKNSKIELIRIKLKEAELELKLAKKEHSNAVSAYDKLESKLASYTSKTHDDKKITEYLKLIEKQNSLNETVNATEQALEKAETKYNNLLVELNSIK